MGPIIITDKSTIQSLSKDELVIFHKYYMPNIVPVLILEILGNLKKAQKNGLTEQEAVKNLANKLLPFDDAVNTFHYDLIRGSLLGVQFTMDGRPILNQGRSVKTEDGKRGIIFEETAEEKALTRWRDGKFNEADDLLAGRWRESSRNQDLEKMKQWIKQWLEDIPKFSSLDDIMRYVNNLVGISNQSGLLAFIISQLGVVQDGPQIFLKWTQAGSPKIINFAPYAIHCFKVNLFCYLGMISGFLGTRTTNSIDMQYLYYLPFAMVFCSNDKFHLDVAPFFLKKNQYLIKGSDLKDDLKIISQLSKQPDGTNCNLDFSLLVDKNSITYKLWNERMAYLPGNERTRDVPASTKKKSADRFKDIMDRIKKESQSETTDEVFGVDEADFVIRKRMMRTNDFCICGSGKLFGECCYKKVNNKQA